MKEKTIGKGSHCPWASLDSKGERLDGITTIANGSVAVWFAPKPPVGFEIHWVQTFPGKDSFILLRLYGPLEPWFNQNWRLGLIELQK